MPKDFGSFTPVFETSPGYLALLHLDTEDSAAAVRLVRQCAIDDADRSSILALLSDPDWRLNLVAAVAAAFLPIDSRINDALWRRFDSGSWVTPQLAVVLASVDPDFQLRARQRLEAHCPLVSSELGALSMLERHIAAGPAGYIERSAKAASALETTLSSAVPRPDWLAAIVATPEHQELVAMDRDASGAIARHWGERFVRIRQQMTSR